MSGHGGDGKRSWFSRPGGLGSLFRVVARGAEDVSANASKLKPKKFRRGGFFGEDWDGGVVRFRMLSDRLSVAEIEKALRRWEHERFVYGIAACASAALIPGCLIAGFLTFYFFIGLVLGGVFFALRYLVADFRAWQIEQGRFGAPAEYLNHRLPRNMQIVGKDTRP